MPVGMSMKRQLLVFCTTIAALILWLLLPSYFTAPGVSWQEALAIRRELADQGLQFYRNPYVRKMWSSRVANVLLTPKKGSAIPGRRVMVSVTMDDGETLLYVYFPANKSFQFQKVGLIYCMQTR